jgi:hypothetical protein
VEDKFLLELNKKRLQGHGKKKKALRYGPFEVLEKVGYNTYRLNLPPYMHIYLVVNVEVWDLAISPNYLIRMDRQPNTNRSNGT